MDLETIKYYLHNLPKSIKSIVTGNSNLEIKYDDNNKFEEVMLDNFPIRGNSFFASLMFKLRFTQTGDTKRKFGTKKNS